MNQSPYPCLVGKTAIVTGAFGGIGRAVLGQLHNSGVKIYAIDRALPSDLAEVDGFDGSEPVHEAIACDLLNIEATRTAVEKIGTSAGSIDCIVHCAGNDARHDWLDLSHDDWDLSQNINLRHVLFVTQASSPFLREGGSIVTFGSKTALTKKGGLIGYATAKAAMMGLTGSLARELGQRAIRVNCIVPGMVRTSRNYEKWVTPEIERSTLERQCLKSVIQPDDVADLVLFLCSSRSRMITGQSILLDGGS